MNSERFTLSKKFEYLVDKMEFKKKIIDAVSILCINTIPSDIEQLELAAKNKGVVNVGCVSGYFDPVHEGHIDYMKAAKKKCDYLVVIVNNDVQRKLKGSEKFMDENERVKIVESISFVDKAVLSIDQDSSVCKTLAKVNPRLFFNGGDRSRKEVPETGVCDMLGIVMVDNVGGDKVQSSSALKKRESKKGEKKCLIKIK